MNGRRIVIARLALLAATALPAAEGSFEKTIPVPRSGDATLGWTDEECVRVVSFAGTLRSPRTP